MSYEQVFGLSSQFNEDVIFLKDVKINGQISFGTNISFNVPVTFDENVTFKKSITVDENVSVGGISTFTGLLMQMMCRCCRYINCSSKIKC